MVYLVQSFEVLGLLLKTVDLETQTWTSCRAILIILNVLYQYNTLKDTFKKNNKPQFQVDWISHSPLLFVS